MPEPAGTSAGDPFVLRNLKRWCDLPGVTSPLAAALGMTPLDLAFLLSSTFSDLPAPLREKISDGRWCSRCREMHTDQAARFSPVSRWCKESRMEYDKMLAERRKSG